MHGPWTLLFFFLIFSIFHREPYGPPLGSSWTQGVQLLAGRGPIASRVGSIPEFLRKLNATCDFSVAGGVGPDSPPSHLNPTMPPVNK